MSPLAILLHSLAALALVLVLPLVVGQTEHKVMAHMQGRLGPMYAGGFHGWAQLIADGVKFAQKEDIIPAAADRLLFKLAPALALIPYIAAIAAIPLLPQSAAAQIPGGALLVLAITSVGVLGTLIGGWASANKYALIGALRSVAQLVSYELPMVVVVASVTLAAGSLTLTDIANAWRPYWLIWQLPGLLVFLTCVLAELQRPPFDMPVADSEVVMGAWTEYTGLRFALFLFAEYVGMVVFTLLGAVLFLGGYRGPWQEQLGWLWTLMKAGLLVFLIIWLRVSWPRLREDQLQRLAWLWLLPIALAQLALTALVVVVWG